MSEKIEIGVFFAGITEQMSERILMSVDKNQIFIRGDVFFFS